MAMFDGDGKVVLLTLSRDESHMWSRFLGWPHEEEIADYKKRGYRVAAVKIIEESAKII